MWKKLYLLLLVAGSQAIIALVCFAAGDNTAGTILIVSAGLTGLLEWFIDDDDPPNAP